MKMCLKKLAVALISGFLLTFAVIVLPASPFVVEAEVHSGSTDLHGGHRNSRNVSDLGSYHHHCGGHPTHLHTNEVCPYATSDTGTSPASQKQVPESKVPVPETMVIMMKPEWKEDGAGWWYCTLDGQYYKGCWQNVDGQWYYFNPGGCMATGWHRQTDHCYYLASGGHVVAGEREIDDEHYYFSTDGSLDDTTSHHGSSHHVDHHN